MDLVAFFTSNMAAPHPSRLEPWFPSYEPLCPKSAGFLKVFCVLQANEATDRKVT
jgi:hypothetical protein